MKTEFRKNEGDVVRSLLDGMFYRVLNISEESVTAKPVEEEDIDGKRVFIETPADTIDVNRNVFDELFFVVEKAPATVPGDGTFSISNGMFLKNGNRIETGTLVPVEIMALIPGAVLLTVRSRTEGKLDLFHYDVETDEFHKLTNAKDRIEFVYGYGSVTGFVVTTNEKVEIPADGDNMEEAELVVQSIRFYSDSSWLFATDGSVGAEYYPLVGGRVSFNNADDWQGRTAHVVQFASSDACREVWTIEGRHLWVRDPDNDGERSTVTKIELAYEEGHPYPEISCDRVSFSGTIEKILACKDEDHNSVFVTAEGIVHSNYGHGKRLAIGRDVLEAVEQYPVPISLNFNGSRDTTFIFGNENYGACRIRVVKTRDRGFVTTVEEIR